MKQRLMRRNGLTAGNARRPKHGRKSDRSVEETRNRVHLMKRRAAKQASRAKRQEAQATRAKLAGRTLEKQRAHEWQRASVSGPVARFESQVPNEASRRADLDSRRPHTYTPS